MNYEHIIAFDPSGNWEEGKGTTGTCLFDVTRMRVKTLRDLHASAYASKEDYWQAHCDYIKEVYTKEPNTLVVIEDFTLDPRRAMQQSHSKMETPKLIGILQLYCQQNDIPYRMQRPVEVKTRWADNILEYKGYIIKKNRMHYIPGVSKPMSRHCKDAIRHAVHCATFYKEKKDG